MALTRKMLSAMDIDAAKIDEIITAHSETVNALKEERDSFQTSAGEVSKLKTRITELETENAKLKETDWQSKYDELKSEYDKFKADVENEKLHAEKEKLFREVLKDIGITEEKAVNKVVKYTDIDALELDDKGKLKDAKTVAKDTKEEWGEYVDKEFTKGADPATPPDNNGGSAFANMTLADKMTYANEHPEDAEVKAFLGK